MKTATSALERLRAAFPKPWRLTTSFGAADCGAPCLARADLFVGPLPGAVVNVDGHGPTPDAAVDALLAAWAAATAPLRDRCERQERLLAASQAEAAALRAGLARMVAAVDGLDAENGDRNLFVSAGCLTCTEGTTPYRYDTGPCAYHTATGLLARVLAQPDAGQPEGEA